MKAKFAVISLFALSLLALTLAGRQLESLRHVLAPLVADQNGRELVVPVSKLFTLQKNLGLMPLIIGAFIYTAGFLSFAGIIVLCFGWRIKSRINRNEN